MSLLTPRQFTPQDLPQLFELISGIARNRWPAPAYLMTSDVAWRLPLSAPEDHIRLWEDKTGLAAFAWFTPNDTLCFNTRDDIDMDRSMTDDLLSWSTTQARRFPPTNPWLLELGSMDEWAEALNSGKHLQKADSHLLFMSAFDHDHERTGFLQANGFEPTNHTAKHLSLTFVDPIPSPQSTDDTLFRHVGDHELEKRCELHRNAWLKSTFSMDQYQLCPVSRIEHR